MTTKEAKAIINNTKIILGRRNGKNVFYGRFAEAIDTILAELDRQEEQSCWIPITTRPCTEEEFEEWREIFGEGIEREEFPYFTCKMPEDGQEILVCTKYGVYMDVCSCDEYNSIGLESNGDWDGVLAWMPLPEPYKKGSDPNA